MGAAIFRRISIVGLGYIGLPTAAMFASRKIEVIGVDVNASTVDTINRGEIHIIEPGLEDVVRTAVREGFLRATLTPEPAEAFLIAVPTPFKGVNREPDLSYIEAAVGSIAPVLKPGNLIILESTSPIGATQSMADWLAAARPDLSFPQNVGADSDIRIAHCPERVLPGRVMQELVSNDRIIGGMTPQCSKQAALLYKTFVKGECIIASSPKVAEMTKLTENSYRDVNIAFANELSLVCDRLDIDVWEVIKLSNHHPRVNILQPGPGVGGHCIAVDPWFIVSSAPDETRLIKTARSVNDDKPDWVLNKIREAIQTYRNNDGVSSSSDLTIALYGLSFKPDIDDLRTSPSLEIARKLVQEHKGAILIVEPHISELPDGLKQAKLVELHSVTADIHVMLVRHQQFNGSYSPQGTIIDACGLWST